MFYLFIIFSVIANLITAKPVAASNNETPTNTPVIFASTTTALPKLSEVMPNPEEGKEWVEIYNPTTQVINLNGLKLCDNRTTSCTIADLSGFLEPDTWLVIYLSSSVLNNSGDSVLLKDGTGAISDKMSYTTTLRGQSIIYTDNGWKKTLTPTPGEENNLSEPLIVASDNKVNYSPPLPPAPPEIKTPAIKSLDIPKPPVKIETIRWKIVLPNIIEVNETSTLNVKETADVYGGHIFFTWRFSDGFTIHGTEITRQFTSPGIHQITVTADSTSGATSSHKINLPIVHRTSTVIITEIAPKGTPTEYIEIYNPLTTTTTLAGWKLGVNNDIYQFPTGTFIGPGKYRVFYEQTTGLKLLDSGGEVYLLVNTTTLADRIIYPKSHNEESFNNETGNWVLNEPSPGIMSTPRIMVLGESIQNQIAKTDNKYNPVIEVKTIAEVRELPKKTYVRVKGTVAALPGTFGTQFFYLTDATGGVQIYEHEKNFPKLAVGMHITVTGEMTSYQTIPRLKMQSNTINTTSPLYPLEKTITELNETDAGQLIQVVGDITEKKSTNMYIDDGDAELRVYFRSGAQINRDRLIEGETIAVTGILEKTQTGLQLWPRGNEDILVVSSTISTNTPNKPVTSQTKLVFTIIIIILIGSGLYLKLKKHPDMV